MGFVCGERIAHAGTDRAGDKINTNTVEGFYSVFKRGMIGVYQHCGEQHLHRYLAEFDFRYPNRIELGDLHRGFVRAKFSIIHSSNCSHALSASPGTFVVACHSSSRS